MAKKLDFAAVCSAYTGEVVHEFKGADIARGRQYWVAWCVGNYYRIVEVQNTSNGCILYVE